MTLEVNMPQKKLYLPWLSIEGAIWILKPGSLQCLSFKLFKKSASVQWVGALNPRSLPRECEPDYVGHSLWIFLADFLLL